MIIYTKKDGYIYKDENTAKRYSLYEMVSLGGKATSDMVGIWDDLDVDIDNIQFVGWFAGASSLSANELDEAVSDYVWEYEVKKARAAAGKDTITYPLTKAGTKAWCGDVVDDILDRDITGDFYISHCGRSIKLPDLAEVYEALENFLTEAEEIVNEEV